MKAAVLVAPRKFEIRDLPMPEMTENHMLVKVEACGVCTSDMPGYIDNISEEAKKQRPFPRRMGHEPSGTIVEVGKNVKGYKVGERITGYFADGCYAQYVSCDPTDPLPRGHGYIIERIPEGVVTEHAMGEPMMDLMSIARTCNPEIGDTVFQAGAGFMGLGVVAGVARHNLKEYIVADLDDFRLGIAKELGATVTLNSGKVDVAAEVMRLTGGRGVDLAIEAIGHPIGMKLVGQAVKRNRGKIVVVGWHQATDSYDLSAWIKSPVIYSPQGVGMSTDPHSELARAMWAIKKGIYPMQKLVTHRYKLEDIDQAFKDNLGRTPGYIKGAVMPWL